MQIATRAARDHSAQSRILAATKALGERFVLNLGEQGILQRLQVQRGDVATRAMLEREAIADLLELVIKATTPVEEGSNEADLDAPAWPDLPENVIETLVTAHYTPESLRSAVVEDLSKLPGIGKRMALKIMLAAQVES
jgi:ATP phosphoribosyltransferase regulatory subunit HisZ